MQGGPAGVTVGTVSVIGNEVTEATAEIKVLSSGEEGGSFLQLSMNKKV